MTISVICPTRNRAALWRSGWLLDSLAVQTRKPDELVIAIDHTEDDTTDAIRSKLTRDRFPITTTILDVKAPRPEPFPASGLPDNCLFHYATSDVLLHVDDDIQLPARFIEKTDTYFDTLPNISIWYPMTFVDDSGKPLDNGQDWRFEVIRRRRYHTQVAGLVKPEPGFSCATGAIFAALSSTIRAIGGHDVKNCGHHNQDTLLGFRLSQACTGGTFVATSPSVIANHRGLTWHMKHRHDGQALAAAYGKTRPGPTIANGGTAYWQSDFWPSAYAVSHTHSLTSNSRRPIFSRVSLRSGEPGGRHANG